MIDLTRHVRLLKALHYLRKLRAVLARSNRAGQEALRCWEAFYEQMWRDAAAQVGASLESLGYGVFEIRRGDAVTRVFDSGFCLSL